MRVSRRFLVKRVQEAMEALSADAGAHHLE